jgi:MFS family permease
MDPTATPSPSAAARATPSGEISLDPGAEPGAGYGADRSVVPGAGYGAAARAIPSAASPPGEVLAAASLAGIFFLRMFGLFLVVPVLSLQAGQLAGASPLLLGIAMGVYGLTQAALQIPFGHLSDRYGRKPIITLGLCLFIAGGVVAALSDHIAGVILGRALQGAGAIAAAVMALAADLTRPEVRGRIMAGIGMSIGCAFALAFAAGPALAARFGLGGVFWAASGAGGLALLLLHTLVPSPGAPLVAAAPKLAGAGDAAAVAKAVAGPGLRALLRDPALHQCNVGIFLLHAVLMASFVAIPEFLRDGAALATAEHWRVYLPAFGASALVMGGMVYITDRRGHVRAGQLVALGLLAGGELLLGLDHGSAGACMVGLFAFFSGFNTLEAVLPALVSRRAPPARKGAALGIYSTAQFLGIFCGGVLGGGIANTVGAQYIPFAALALCLYWLSLVARPTRPA